MKKIGIVTWYYSSNYGTCLQAFALNRFLKLLGYDCYFLNKRVTIWVLFLRIQTFVKSKLGINQNTTVGEHPLKMSKVSLLIKNEFRKSPRYFFGFQLQRIQKKTDFFIVGSDQVWNPYYLDDHYLLANIDKSIKKISYASSLGVTELPESIIPIYKKYLNCFDSLSVREETGAQIIRKLVNKTVTVVLDPTLLLTSQEWINFSLKANIENTFDEPFILCYFVGDDITYWEKVYKIQEKTNIKRLLVIPLEKTHYTTNGIIYEYAGPYEFVWLLNHASLICTDSFHATTLCINLQKEFIEFLRFRDDDEKSQNSRIYQLLEHYKLESRYYNEDLKNVCIKIDYSIPYNILLEDRDNSKHYLTEALK